MIGNIQRRVLCVSAHSHRTIVTATTEIPKLGDVLTLKCSELTTGGGLCKLDSGFIVFVDRALPGEELKAKVYNVTKSKFAKAAKLETLQAHNNAVEPQCPHFGTCGGCSLQSLSYDAQLQAKEQHITQIFKRVGGISNIESLTKPALRAGSQYKYRNKMEFSFGSSSTENIGVAPQLARGRNVRQQQPVFPKNSNKFILGLHAPGSYSQIVPIDSCALQSDIANDILKYLEDALCSSGLSADISSQQQQQGNRTRRRNDSQEQKSSNERTTKPPPTADSKSILQHVVVRVGYPQNAAAAPTYLVNIITSRDARKELAPIAKNILQQFADQGLIGVVNSVSAAGKPLGERSIAKEYPIAGKGNLTTSMCGLDYIVSPNSFFQVNTPQAEILYQHVLESADIQPTDTVLDLFCGAGSMTLLFAKRAATVVGIDISQSAIHDAISNAKLNKLTDDDVSFVCGDVTKLLSQQQEDSDGSEKLKLTPQPDVVITDPNRAGMSREVVEYLRRCGARRIVYVSCDPGTQARDIKGLCAEIGDNDVEEAADSSMKEWRYELRSVQPVDLFPQTFHVENVAVLDRVD